jgi:uncharacterized membrane protein
MCRGLGVVADWLLSLEEQLKGQFGALIKSNLTNEQEAKLNEAFGEELMYYYSTVTLLAKFLG